jgi:nicotinamidase/pyrazinamidase
MKKSALIVVDVQRDFCDGGALAASDTLSLLQPLRDYVDAVRKKGALIVYTQDWHPEHHNSFGTKGGRWPVHCVAGTPGAELMPPLQAGGDDLVIHKGEDDNGEGFSGFDNTPLDQELRRRGIEDVAVAGIATEYCVRATALDAHCASFPTTVLEDLIRPVRDEDTAGILADLRHSGVKVTRSADWPASA